MALWQGGGSVSSKHYTPKLIPKPIPRLRIKDLEYWSIVVELNAVPWGASVSLSQSTSGLEALCLSTVSMSRVSHSLSSSLSAWGSWYFSKSASPSSLSSEECWAIRTFLPNVPERIGQGWQTWVVQMILTFGNIELLFELKRVLYAHSDQFFFFSLFFSGKWWHKASILSASVIRECCYRKRVMKRSP